jgi:hypothetical protein
MKKRRHVLILAGIVARHVQKQPRSTARLLTSQLRCVAEHRVPQLARDLGVAEMIERARNEHLASLDADEGLVALSVEGLDVVHAALRLLDSTPARCSRCGARLPRRRLVCSCCRQPVPRGP